MSREDYQLRLAVPSIAASLQNETTLDPPVIVAKIIVLDDK